MCPGIPQLIHTPRSSWREKHSEEGQPRRGPRVAWGMLLWVPAPNLGLALGAHSKPALCLVLPPPHTTPWRHPQRSRHSSFQLSRKGHQARCVLEASEGVFPASASGPWVHTCPKARRLGGSQPWTVTVSPANARGGQRQQEPLGESSPPTLPTRDPAKGSGDPANPPVGRERTQERAMAEAAGWETAQPGR